MWWRRHRNRYKQIEIYLFGSFIEINSRQNYFSRNWNILPTFFLFNSCMYMPCAYAYAYAFNLGIVWMRGFTVIISWTLAQRWLFRRTREKHTIRGGLVLFSLFLFLSFFSYFSSCCGLVSLGSFSLVFLCFIKLYKLYIRTYSMDAKILHWTENGLYFYGLAANIVLY